MHIRTHARATNPHFRSRLAASRSGVLVRVLLVEFRVAVIVFCVCVLIHTTEFSSSARTSDDQLCDSLPFSRSITLRRS